jgi:hypothetical protein
MCLCHTLSAVAPKEAFHHKKINQQRMAIKSLQNLPFLE